MAYSREKLTSTGSNAHVLGTVLEYNSMHEGGNPSKVGKTLAIVIVLAVAAFSIVSARGCLGGNGGRQRKTMPEMKRTVLMTTPEPVNTNASDAAVSKAAARLAEKWLSNAASRPASEKTLLERLATAERQGKIAIVVDTLEKLRTRPSMADIEDLLSRRLGDLNTERLFGGARVPWVGETVVKRGDTLNRIAREHGTTILALMKLNGITNGVMPETGTTLRTLEFPHSALVIHKRIHTADLSINGRFFKRFYVSANLAPVGSYPISRATEEGPRARFSKLGVKFIPSDSLELEMFLAPGSVLTISEN